MASFFAQADIYGDEKDERRFIKEIKKGLVELDGKKLMMSKNVKEIIDIEDDYLVINFTLVKRVNKYFMVIPLKGYIDCDD
ncbi:MAG: hypothetical protein HQK65_19075 [Desulfamplus sp.]|nr:hypothetical protein [Desulfamplus sp.]